MKIIHYKGSYQFREQEFHIGNLIEIAKKEVIKDLDYLIDEKNFEPQLMSTEFVDLLMRDNYGNSYNYDIKFLKNEDNYLVVRGSISDNNQVHYTLKNYFIEQSENTIEPEQDKRKHYKRYNKYLREHNEIKTGFIDKTPRSMPIITDSVASFMQANKNQIEAQKQTFNENADMINKQNNLNTQRTLMNNQFSLANIDFQNTQNLVNTGFGVANSLLGIGMGNILGGTLGLGANLMSGIFGYEKGQMLKEQQSQVNDMNLASVTLSNYKSKLNYLQGLRGYNASLGDMYNRPNTIQQLGNDIAFQGGYKLDGIYFDIKISNKIALNNAYNYFRLFGVRLNKQVSNLWRFLQNGRSEYNFIKMNKVVINNNKIPQQSLSVIEELFKSGVRIWNYKQDMKFKDFTVKNYDN